MMQRVQVVYNPTDPEYDPDLAANYDVASKLASWDAAEIEDIYKKPSQDDMYERSVSFLDDNNSGQTFPFKSGWTPPSPQA